MKQHTESTDRQSYSEALGRAALECFQADTGSMLHRGGHLCITPSLRGAHDHNGTDTKWS